MDKINLDLNKEQPKALINKLHGALLTELAGYCNKLVPTEESPYQWYAFDLRDDALYKGEFVFYAEDVLDLNYPYDFAYNYNEARFFDLNKERALQEGMQHD